MPALNTFNKQSHICDKSGPPANGWRPHHTKITYYKMISNASGLDTSFGMTQRTENGHRSDKGCGHVASSCEHRNELSGTKK